MNQIYRKYFAIFLAIWSLTSFQSSAQGGRTTEEEVNTQKVFIDANREKILGNYENAAYLYKEVLKRDKENHAAAYELARIYDVLDKDDKALRSIKMAIALDDTNPWYKMFEADVYKKMGKNKEAAKVYEALTKEDSNSDFYYFKWAYFLVLANEPAKAIKVYDQLEKKIGVTEELATKKHALYLGIGDNKKAGAELKKLIKVFPYEPAHRHRLAQFYTDMGQKDLAKKEYRTILDIDPDDAHASIALADDLKKSGNDAKYLSSLQTIFKKSDVDIDTKVKEMIPYIHKVADKADPELTSAAIELAEILETVHPSEAKSFSLHGDLLYYSGNKKEALKKYKKTIELDDTVFSVWEQIMYVNLELKDIEALRSFSEKAIDLFPNKAKAYYMNGVANGEQKNHAGAVDVFEQALMMSGKNTQLKFDILSRLGKHYFFLKKFDRSDKAYENALKLNPKSFDALNTYSYFLAVRGEKLDKAKEMVEIANELKPNNPSAQDTYGWILYKMKDYKGAKDWLSKSINNGGEAFPDILEHYGDVLYQLNDIDAATDYWQKAQEKGSKSGLLEKKIADRQLYE